MAVKKIVIRPEGTNDYADELYPKTTASQVVEETNKKFMTDAERTKLANLTKADVGLSNVDNVKQMPIAGGTFTGVAVGQANTSYTTRQLRNITLSTADPSGGSNGDVWIKYTP